MIIFSEHAKQRMEQRSVDKKLVVKTVEEPDKIEKSFRGRKLRQKEFDGRILEVVTKIKGEEIIVITQYWLTK